MMPGPRTVAGLNEPATMMSRPRRLGRQAFRSASLQVGKPSGRQGVAQWVGGGRGPGAMHLAVDDLLRCQ